MVMTDSPLVFISYARPDRDRVAPFEEYLRSLGFVVWVDFIDLKAGQDWQFEIERAMDKAAIILAFISQNSVDRRGFVQREIRAALDKAHEKLADDIYLVPVLFDDVEIPRQLRHLHCISASEPQCRQLITDALTHQIERLGRSRRDFQRREGISWESRTIRESWDGFPGFEVEIQYPEFRSQKYTNVFEVTEAIKGRLLLKLFEERGLKIHQMPEIFQSESNRFRRTNTYDARCLEPNVIGRVLSIQYRIHWYGAGAAHPNMHFETYNFVLEPLTLIPNLLSTLSELARAPAMIREEVRRVLYAIRLPHEAGDKDYSLDPKWIDKGTESFEALDSFWFTQSGLEFLFAPYQVGSYADGSHTALVPYEMVVPLMRPAIASALGLQQFL
jgi:hypothetical protein